MVTLLATRNEDPSVVVRTYPHTVPWGICATHADRDYVVEIHQRPAMGYLTASGKAALYLRVAIGALVAPTSISSVD